MYHKSRLTADLLYTEREHAKKDISKFSSGLAQLVEHQISDGKVGRSMFVLGIAFLCVWHYRRNLAFALNGNLAVLK